MATCKECLHWKVCNEYRGAFWGHKAQYSSPIINASADSCIFYKDRSRFVELPCKIGNKLYLSTESINKIIHLLGTYESSPEIFEIVPEKQIKQALKEREQRNNTD